MGGDQGGLPLSTVPGREITTDTVLLANAASGFPGDVLIDLGTGAGAVLSLYAGPALLKAGLDFSAEALSAFDRAAGSGVLCSVEIVSRAFRSECADIVTANPPYNIAGETRMSPDPIRRQAREGEPLLLHRFIFAAKHLLKPGGVVLMTGKPSHRMVVEQGMRAAGFHEFIHEEHKGVSLFFGSVPYSGSPKDSSGIPGSV